jgi:hypothetical protein
VTIPLHTGASAAGSTASTSRPAWGPCAVVGAAIVAIWLSGLRGGDYPAHLLRAELWKRSGASVWNMYWYGGHSTPTYSVVAPPLVATFGPLAVIAVGTVLAVYCFALLVADLLPGRSAVATYVFAICCIPNVIVGRTPFALGLGVALATVLTWRRDRLLPAVGLAMLTTLCSPVAGVFLLMATTAVLIERCHRSLRSSPRRPAPGLRPAAIVTAAAIAPLAVLGSTFGSGGHFPFRADHLVFSVFIAVVVGWSIRVPVLRIGVAVTALTSVLVYAIPNPMGGNFLRLVQQVGVPLVAYAAWRVRWSMWAPLTVLAVVAIGWSLQSGVVAAEQWAGDDSVEAEYHRPLVAEVQRRNAAGGPLGRLEIPFTDNHWESLYVSLEVPSARGWERQLDLALNEELYDPELDLAGYRDWLDHNAVRWIALADAPIDEGGLAEWELLQLEATGIDIPWLDEVWANEDWTLYEVADYRPIIDAPAELVRQGTDDLVLSTPAPATVTLRYTYTDAMSIEGESCIEPDDDGWTVVHLVAAGIHRITLDPAESIDPGAADGCDSSGSVAEDD